MHDGYITLHGPSSSVQLAAQPYWPGHLRHTARLLRLCLPLSLVSPGKVNILTLFCSVSILGGHLRYACCNSDANSCNCRSHVVYSGLSENFNKIHGETEDQMHMLGVHRHLYLCWRSDCTDHLAGLKVDSLRPYIPRAKEMYRHHLDLYVQSILGRPMERLRVSWVECHPSSPLLPELTYLALQTFFEGVQRLIQSGMAANDVRYQFDFSKQALLDCIRLYPGKEVCAGAVCDCYQVGPCATMLTCSGSQVKRGLESMYKRVERQLSSHLLVVVWRNIQEEFVKLYSEYDALIQNCYPGSNIKLEFNVQDLLAFFTSIAEKGS